MNIEREHTGGSMSSEEREGLRCPLCHHSNNGLEITMDEWIKSPDGGRIKVKVHNHCAYESDMDRPNWKEELAA